MWLWAVFTEFVQAVANGDKSWWPFLAGVVLIAAVWITVGMA